MKFQSNYIIPLWLCSINRVSISVIGFEGIFIVLSMNILNVSRVTIYLKLNWIEDIFSCLVLYKIIIIENNGSPRILNGRLCDELVKRCFILNKN